MLSGLIRIAVASLIAAAVPCGSFAQEAPATSPTAPSSAPAAPAASSGEGSTGEIVDLPAQPFAYIEGKADRDEIYGAILGSLSLVKHDMDKANVVPGGRPLAVFVESDD